MAVSKALKELREDQFRVILTLDKRVAMVVLDEQDYINKAHDLLTQKDTYNPITMDPTDKHKDKLIKVLRTIKVQGGLGKNTYKNYLTGAVPPNVMNSQSCINKAPP